jgi:predicted deacetylase
MGDIAPTIITRVVREMAEDEPLSKDYDFSALSIEQHKQRGYRATLDALKGLATNNRNEKMD